MHWVQTQGTLLSLLPAQSCSEACPTAQLSLARGVEVPRQRIEDVALSSASPLLGHHRAAAVVCSAHLLEPPRKVRALSASFIHSCSASWLRLSPKVPASGSCGPGSAVWPWSAELFCRGSRRVCTVGSCQGIALIQDYMVGFSLQLKYGVRGRLAISRILHMDYAVCCVSFHVCVSNTNTCLYG